MILYGAAKSQACRSLWMLEELGAAYRHEIVTPYKDTRTPAFLAINPNGHVPVLDDDGFVLWEAAAINLYLAEKFGAPLWPRTLTARADAYRWSFWVATESTPALRDVIRARASGNAERTERATTAFTNVLAVIDRHLADRAYLLGETFSVADVNVASALRHPHESGPIYEFADFDMSGLPHLNRWIAQCSARPANRRTAALAAGEP